MPEQNNNSSNQNIINTYLRMQKSATCILNNSNILTEEVLLVLNQFLNLESRFLTNLHLNSTNNPSLQSIINGFLSSNSRILNMDIKGFNENQLHNSLKTYFNHMILATHTLISTLELPEINDMLKQDNVFVSLIPNPESINFFTYLSNLLHGQFKDIINNSVKRYDSYETLKGVRGHTESIPTKNALLKFACKLLLNNTSIKYIKINAFPLIDGAILSLNGFLNINDLMSKVLPLIDGGAIPSLKDTLSKKSNLVELSLSIHDIIYPYSTYYIKLLDELADTPYFTKLYISHIGGLSEDLEHSIIKAIKNWSRLFEVDLHTTVRSDSNFLERLLEALENGKSLKSIKLSLRDFSNDHTEILANILEKNVAPIDSLTLNNTSSLSKMFFSSFGKNTTLKELTLDGSYLDKSDYSTLEESLGANKTLNNLKLLNCSFDDRSLIEFSKALNKSKITKLTFSHREFSEENINEGYRALIDSLGSDSPLFSLSFESIELSLENLLRLPEALKNNQTLSKLKISYGITEQIEEFMPKFAEYLTTNTTLESVEFDGLECSPSSIKLLFNALKVNTGLKEINLSDIYFSNDIFTYIAELINHNKTLTKICFKTDQDHVDFSNIEPLIALRDALKQNKLVDLDIDAYYPEDNQEITSILKEIEALSARNKKIMDYTKDAYYAVQRAIYELDAKKVYQQSNIEDSDILKKISLKDIAIVQQNKLHVKAILDKDKLLAKQIAFLIDQPVRLLPSQEDFNDINIFNKKFEELVFNHLINPLAQEINPISANNNNNAQTTSLKRHLEEASESEQHNVKEQKLDIAGDHTSMDLTEPLQQNNTMHLTGKSSEEA
jgi:hypothetical protein